MGRRNEVRPGRIRRGGVLATVALGLVTACGRTSEEREPEGARAGDQARVPAELQKPGLLRYFQVDDADGPYMVVFDDPAEPRVVPIGPGTGVYRTRRGAWSADGRVFAYTLEAEEPGVEQHRVMVARADDDFSPHPIEDEWASVEATDLRWIGPRTFAVPVAKYYQDYADPYEGRLLLVNAETLKARTLAPATRYSADPLRMWAWERGLMFVSDPCELSYADDTGLEHHVVDECVSDVRWSGDGAYAAIFGEHNAYLYATESNDLRLLELAALSSSLIWAPAAPLFVSYPASSNPLQSAGEIVLGDARSGSLVPLELPATVNHALLATDSLLVASAWGDQVYVADLAFTEPGEAPAFSPVDISPERTLVAASDGSRLYSQADPLLEIELERGLPAAVTPIAASPAPATGVKLELLGSDATALVTFMEPTVPNTSAGRDQYHQYVLTLRGERSVIDLAHPDMAVGTEAQGDRHFMVRPGLGGLLYIGENDTGMYVDWLGFDDITRRVPLWQGSIRQCCLVHAPREIVAPP